MPEVESVLTFFTPDVIASLSKTGISATSHANPTPKAAMEMTEYGKGGKPSGYRSAIVKDSGDFFRILSSLLCKMKMRNLC
jgi:hypothetical protein